MKGGRREVFYKPTILMVGVEMRARMKPIIAKTSAMRRFARRLDEENRLPMNREPMHPPNGTIEE